MDVLRPDNARSEKLQRIVYGGTVPPFPGGVTIGVGPVAHQQELHYSC